MKRAKVSALRERGLHRVCGAEPQCLVVNSNSERKADTMKTYILRPINPVERQSRRSDDPPTSVKGSVRSIVTSNVSFSIIPIQQKRCPEYCNHTTEF